MIKLSSYIKLLQLMLEIIKKKGVCTRKDIINTGLYSPSWLSRLFRDSYLLEYLYNKLKKENK